MTLPDGPTLVLIGGALMVAGNLAHWAWTARRDRRRDKEFQRRSNELNARLDRFYREEPVWRHGELFRASGPWRGDGPSGS